MYICIFRKTKRNELMEDFHKIVCLNIFLKNPNL